MRVKVRFIAGALNWSLEKCFSWRSSEMMLIYLRQSWRSCQRGHKYDKALLVLQGVVGFLGHCSCKTTMRHVIQSEVDGYCRADFLSISFGIDKQTKLPQHWSVSPIAPNKSHPLFLFFSDDHFPCMQHKDYKDTWIMKRVFGLRLAFRGCFL